MELLVLSVRLIGTAIFFFYLQFSFLKFKDKRKAVKKCSIIGSVCVVLSIAVYILFSCEADIVYIINDILLLLLSIFALTRMKTDDIFCYLFVLFSVINIYVLVINLTMAVELVIAKNIYLELMLRLILYPIICKVLSKSINVEYIFLGTQLQKEWKALSFVPILFLFVIIFFGGFELTKELLPFAAAIYMLEIIMYLIIFKLLKMNYEAYLQKETEHALKIQIENQAEQNHLIKEKMEEVKIIRHDIRHNLAILQTILANGRVKEAEEYINNLLAQTERVKIVKYCNNLPLNALISYYVDFAEKKEISVIHHIYLPDNLEPIKDEHLCVIFGNALENAIEACARIEEKDKRFLDIGAILNNKEIYIIVKNSYTGVIEYLKNGLPKTGKASGGIGLLSIRTIAGMYDGTAIYSNTEQMFVIEVSLKMEKNLNSLVT